MGKIVPKRKQWAVEEEKGSKRVKAEVKSTQTEESPDGISNEAYELMVKGRSDSCTLLTWPNVWLVFPICTDEQLVFLTELSLPWFRNAPIYLLERSGWGA